ncbi:MAG TPA: type IX secretion system membrane protein PorP/SprF [Chryseosolibacter sp.]|nr:type IX secretion system membrane protein PorP/SprF [Chryseosolibacter sp.]
MNRLKAYRSFVLVTLFVTLSHSVVMAQLRVQFTQYMFNGLVINPAYAGADDALSLTLVQRRQWAGVENAPSTQTLSAHTLFYRKNVGVGMVIMNDRVGVHRNLNILTNYAYHVHVGDESVVSFGLQAGMKSIRSDYASLGPVNNDPKVSNAYVSETFFDAGTGIYFRSPKIHAGFSALELFPKTVSLNDTVAATLSRAHYFIFSKYTMPFGQHVHLEPSLLLKCLPGTPVSFDVNLNALYRKVLVLGVSYRKKESVDLLLKAQMTAQLQFGYSYDHPVGEVARFATGSHEFMVQYLFRYVTKNVSSPR